MTREWRGAAMVLGICFLVPGCAPKRTQMATEQGSSRPGRGWEPGQKNTGPFGKKPKPG